MRSWLGPLALGLTEGARLVHDLRHRGLVDDGRRRRDGLGLGLQRRC